ncbi:hypothetical protein M406DRAFT_328616 [Cryphonectria parasitica EP155]|uniref:Uncharacterized protein n=1 Tax=Cryphonectria parasitica (strain ATCC 38755 / EP155) TaxID=660469 RepID=A0A9P4Y6T4_CRYP1|nr:uncharacterized protein M406DRAFT_328616 [Cryphonectria parasitica EP155]KAF3767545.1 hypothetical protein M406DRAFT_328616 [Cryphonectria parasitica EP155]
MQFPCILAAVLAFSEAGLAFSGGYTGQVATHIKWKSPTVKERGDLTIGGLTLGSGDNGGQPGGAAAATGTTAAGQSNSTNTGGGGGSSLTLPNGLTLGGDGGGNANANANANTQNSALDGFLAAAQGAAKNQTGTADAATAGTAQTSPGQGEAASPTVAAEGATGAGTAETAQAAEAGQPKAVAESDQFSEDAGITLDSNGNAQNLGGDLGITKGSDGSTSVGGASGINISPAASA